MRAVWSVFGSEIIYFVDAVDAAIIFLFLFSFFKRLSRKIVFLEKLLWYWALDFPTRRVVIFILFQNSTFYNDNYWEYILIYICEEL